jgi:hypothetical protein
MSIYHEFKSHGIEVLDNKYFKWYCELVDRRIECPSPDDYVERHHWIPKSLHPNDGIVVLSAREHFIAHLLLIKFLKDDNLNKMRNAFFGMSKHQSFVSGRTYEALRKAFNVRNIGSSNPSCNGVYHTPWGSFDFLGDAIDKCPGSTTKSTVIKYCHTYNDRVITEHMVIRSQLLIHDDIGKTFHDVGFWFEPKSGYTPNVSFIVKGASMKCVIRDKKPYKTDNDFHRNRNQYIDSSGVKNSNWRGTYHINDMSFDTAKDLSEYTGLSRSFISTLFKDGLNDIITKRQSRNNVFLKSLSFDP